jgi:hypothetical protein
MMQNNRMDKQDEIVSFHHFLQQCLIAGQTIDISFIKSI